MGMARVADAIHVEGFPLLPVSAAKQPIEAGDGEVAIALQKHLQAHLLQLGLERQILATACR